MSPNSRHPDFRKPFPPTKCKFAGCKFVARTRSNETRHIEAVHMGLKPFACWWPGCAHRSSQKQAVAFHYRTIHLGHKWLTCHFCSRQFNHKNTLRSHMSSHRNQGHDMDQCDDCRVNLRWTPGRGKWAKSGSVPQSLVPQHKRRTRRSRQSQEQPGTSDSGSQKCDPADPRVMEQEVPDMDDPRAVAQTVDAAVQKLLQWRQQTDQLWHQTLSTIRSNGQSDDSDEEQDEKSDDGDEEDGPDEKLIQKKVRTPLFLCKQMGCSCIFSDQESLDLHLRLHSTQ